MRVFLVNVGANASHGGLRSPLFGDGRFEFAPIPEPTGRARAPVLRYRDLRTADGRDALTRYFPSRFRERPAHADPEFLTPSYGDNCRRSPRAATLRAAAPGDWLLFYARLVPWAEGRFVGPPCFAFVGAIEVATIHADLTTSPPEGVLRQIRRNAHVRTALAPGGHFDGFWVFVGTSRSRRFERAVPFTRTLAQAVLRDARGKRWRWSSNRSELQTIGAYARTIRCILDDTRPAGQRRLFRLSHHLHAHGACALSKAERRSTDA